LHEAILPISGFFEAAGAAKARPCFSEGVQGRDLICPLHYLKQGA
jgi:hypothetical protein